MNQLKTSKHSLNDRHYYSQNVKYAKLLNPIILASAFITTMWIITGLIRIIFLEHENYDADIIIRFIYRIIYSLQVIFNIFNLFLFILNLFIVKYIIFFFARQSLRDKNIDG